MASLATLVAETAAAEATARALKQAAPVKQAAAAAQQAMLAATNARAQAALGLEAAVEPVVEPVGSGRAAVAARAAESFLRQCQRCSTCRFHVPRARRRS